jgi:hypothetical protein
MYSSMLPKMVVQIAYDGSRPDLGGRWVWTLRNVMTGALVAKGVECTQWEANSAANAAMVAVYMGW